ncbi:hypothetical protein TSAR_013341 [Trichomalopsis sarcophagae]|uniref:Uncharacterized protein n=1 Tax=Trichomalopsis sarcophagae TaxID=543379 RepID=A0A232EHJ4_9HYME|nr:hypothetical protein TSAR_013341 [Trichomalopsis sarcophagae]
MYNKAKSCGRLPQHLFFFRFFQAKNGIFPVEATIYTKMNIWY